MWLLLLLFPYLSSADKHCPDRPYQLKGAAVRQVQEFDQFLAKLRKPEEFAARLAKDGLPFSLDIKKGGVKGVADWISAEGISGGPEAYVFLRRLSVGASTGLKLDQVFLLAKVTDKKAVLRWDVPFNSFYPIALDGDELLFRQNLFPFCKDGDSQEVLLGVRPDGSLRVRSEKLPAEDDKMVKNCPAKKFFPHSEYAACSEITDRKTKKKMVLVWEQPMT